MSRAFYGIELLPWVEMLPVDDRIWFYPQSELTFKNRAHTAYAPNLKLNPVIKRDLENRRCRIHEDFYKYVIVTFYDQDYRDEYLIEMGYVKEIIDEYTYFMTETSLQIGLQHSSFIDQNYDYYEKFTLLPSVSEWLSCNSNAKVTRLHGSYKIDFLSADDALAFRMAWF